MSYKFKNVMDITEQKQYVLIQQINALQLERDQIIADKDNIKNESEKLTQFNTRPMPKKFNENYNDEEDEHDEHDIDDNHISKLENLLKITKKLLDENEDEKMVKQLLQQ